MSGALLQNLAVAAIVIGAVVFLVRRQLRRRAKPTAMCGDCPGCAPVPMPPEAKGAGLVGIDGLSAKKR